MEKEQPQQSTLLVANITMKDQPAIATSSSKKQPPPCLPTWNDDDDDDESANKPSPSIHNVNTIHDHHHDHHCSAAAAALVAVERCHSSTFSDDSLRPPTVLFDAVAEFHAILESTENLPSEESESRVGAFRIPGPGAGRSTIAREPSIMTRSVSATRMEIPLEATLVVEEEEAVAELPTVSSASTHHITSGRSSRIHSSSQDYLEEAMNVQVLVFPLRKRSTHHRDVHDDRPPKYWKHYVAFFVCVAVMVLILAVSLVLQTSKHNNDTIGGYPQTQNQKLGEQTGENVTNDSTSTMDLITTTTTPVAVFYPPYDPENMAPQTIRAIETQDGTSPQYLANRWMQLDPKLITYPPWRQQQRFAMAVKYYAAGGDNWYRNDHWLSYNVSECYWYSNNTAVDATATTTTSSSSSSSSCDDQGRIVYCQLQSNNLVGVFPLEHVIPSLRKGDHSNNHLTGTLPVLSHVGALEETIVSNNQLEGPLVALPDVNYSTLRVAKLDSNQLEGNIQLGLHLLHNIEVLNLTSNLFGRGKTIPTQLEYTTKLTYLGLGHNEYSGSIPSQLQVLTNLQELDLSGNPGVNGSLPEFLGSSLLELRFLDISGTAISGTVPDSLCLRTRLAEDNDTRLTLVADCDETGLLQCCP